MTEITHDHDTCEMCRLERAEKIKNVIFIALAGLAGYLIGSVWVEIMARTLVED